jgi:hypothetical protein
MERDNHLYWQQHLYIIKGECRGPGPLPGALVVSGSSEHTVPRSAEGFALCAGRGGIGPRFPPPSRRRRDVS